MVPQDVGRLARLVERVGDPSTPGVIIQRLATGESLKEIAQAWDIPYRRFLAWIAANADLTEQCKRALELAGIELRLEGLEIIDEAKPEDVSVAKERAQYRERLSRDLNRPLFGKHTKHEHTHSFDLGERLRRAMARERVIESDVETPATLPAPVPEPGLI